MDSRLRGNDGGYVYSGIRMSFAKVSGEKYNRKGRLKLMVSDGL